MIQRSRTCMQPQRCKWRIHKHTHNLLWVLLFPFYFFLPEVVILQENAIMSWFFFFFFWLRLLYLSTCFFLREGVTHERIHNLFIFFPLLLFLFLPEIIIFKHTQKPLSSPKVVILQNTHNLLRSISFLVYNEPPCNFSPLPLDPLDTNLKASQSRYKVNNSGEKRASKIST